MSGPAGQEAVRLTVHAARGCLVNGSGERWQLELPAGSNRQYRLAQLDDYSLLPRRGFPHKSIDLQVRARVSASAVAGTWGFGLWNDTFGLNGGGTGSAFRLPTLPNAVWFFHASKESWLSLRDDTPRNGLMAQVFCSPRFHPRLIRGTIAFPFSRARARRILSTAIREESRSIGVEPTGWHDYHIRWTPDGAAFKVDGVSMLETGLAPRGPLGLVLWIDNQYAAFSGDGRLAFGILGAPTPVRLEIEKLAVAHP